MIRGSDSSAAAAPSRPTASFDCNGAAPLLQIFNLSVRRSHSLASVYSERINVAIDRHPKRLAACVMEPVLQVGLGG